jgi:hypothetical protein
MPSSSAKQHRFMAAIAHNPSFAKKVGVSQSVGKDFNAADKGKTFNKGGIMKKRKFATGGLEDEGFTPEESYDEEGNPSTVYRKGFSPNIRMSEKKSTAKPAAKPAAKAKSADKNKPAGDTYFDGDYPSSMITTSSGFRKYVPKSGRGLVGIVGNEDEGDRLRARLGDTDDQFKGISRAERLFRRDTEAGIKQMKRGGMMKESKAMVGKEVAFMKKKGAPASMIKHEKAEMGMKKGGMPMKDGKPIFMKKMMGGGMAKGGGVESRGKTKGTMVRMATGGSVGSASRRADGIAQRGKTRC